MGRHRSMTLGVLLILIGIQFYCVRTYWVTPKAAQFVQRRIMEVDEATSDNNTSPYFSTSYSASPTSGIATSGAGGYSISPPSWIKWAALFAGSVMLLQGATIPK